MRTRLPILFFLTLLLAACGTDGNHFKLSGRLLNMNQGSFFVYSSDGALEGIDTIRVQGGRFALEIPCERATTLMLVFPNFSEQPIFAEPGKSVNIAGNASHLKEMKVEGTKANEQMSSLRQRFATASPPEIKKYAAQFIEDNPDSPVGVYLVRRYFMADATPDYAEADRLVKLMSRRQRSNGELVKMEAALAAIRRGEVGQRLPAFTTRDMDGRTVSSSQFAKGTAVIFTWASWSYDSQGLLRAVKDIKRTAGSRLRVLSIALDANKEDCRNTLRMDTVSWQNVCDGRMFEGTPIRQLGLLSLPGCLVVKDGRIIDRNPTVEALKQRLKNL